MGILSDGELEQFAEHGYVRVPEAVPAALVARTQAVIWAQLHEKAGMVREDVTTWNDTWVGINKELLDKTVGVEISPRLHGVVDQLLGAGRWKPLKTLGGLLLTMPGHHTGDWDVPAKLWHVDNDPRTYLADLSELMLFTFYSSVKPQGGGTPVLSGSHRLFREFFAREESVTQGDLGENLVRFANWHPYLAELMGARPRTRAAQTWLDTSETVHGVRVRVVELTGEPGEAILCHPAMLHTVAKNTLPTPRMMRRTNFRRVK